MTKEELAEQYANEKTAEFTQAIKEAYLKGYEQGKLKTASTINVDGVEYVDLGLPSGTLWSSCSIDDIVSWEEAQKLNIPNFEQIDEFKKFTGDLPVDDTLVYAIGVNGNRIKASIDHLGEGVKESGHDGNYYWIKSETQNLKAPCLHIRKFGFHQRLEEHFKGYKLPVFLVKNKSELQMYV